MWHYAIVLVRTAFATLERYVEQHEENRRTDVVNQMHGAS